MNKRLTTALGAYGVLGGIGAFTVHGRMLWALLILLGYFGVRTLIAEKMRLQSERERLEQEIGSGQIRDGSSPIGTIEADPDPEAER